MRTNKKSLTLVSKIKFDKNLVKNKNLYNINKIKNNLESPHLKLSNSINKNEYEIKNKYFICPNCKSEIPILIPYIIKNKIYFRVKCNCKFEKNMKAKEFLQNNISFYEINKLYCDLCKNIIKNKNNNTNIKEKYNYEDKENYDEENNDEVFSLNFIDENENIINKFKKEKEIDYFNCSNNDNIDNNDNLNENNINYCINCNKYICNLCEKNFKEKENHHFIFPFEFFYNNLCEKHDIYHINYYCKECVQGLCKKCIKDNKHKDHNIITLEKFYYILKDQYKKFNINKIKEKLEYNKKLIDNYIKVCCKLKIELNNQLIDIYNFNETFNNFILNYLKRIYEIIENTSTSKLFCFNLLYNFSLILNFNYNLLDLNFSLNYDYDKNQIEEMTTDLIKYFRTDYIIKIINSII